MTRMLSSPLTFVLLIVGIRRSLPFCSCPNHHSPLVKEWGWRLDGIARHPRGAATDLVSSSDCRLGGDCKVIGLGNYKFRSTQSRSCSFFKRGILSSVYDISVQRCGCEVCSTSYKVRKATQEGASSILLARCISCKPRRMTDYVTCNIQRMTG